jgi:hypothetical protein
MRLMLGFKNCFRFADKSARLQPRMSKVSFAPAVYYFVVAVWRAKEAQSGVKYWEIITENLKKAGWSYGYVSTLDCKGRTIWIADAHRDDGKCYVVRVDEKLTAFLELESAIRFRN